VAKEFSRLDETLREFIDGQGMFFVATAPSEGGRINVSPKGYRYTFAVLDERTVAYLDLFGSGADTIAHLRDNGRITLMFCSFTEIRGSCGWSAPDARSARITPNSPVC
jgi:hypothetical protein